MKTLLSILNEYTIFAPLDEEVRYIGPPTTEETPESPLDGVDGGEAPAPEAPVGDEEIPSDLDLGDEEAVDAVLAKVLGILQKHWNEEDGVDPAADAIPADGVEPALDGAAPGGDATCTDCAIGDEEAPLNPEGGDVPPAPGGEEDDEIDFDLTA